ncbi:MAG: UDP-N-acetylmuramate--L-alanine ligase, partial [Spirochaetaceae bacterium]|nr:UDP-N-acetylmuramate--L-alanine ligase [Spirochaetaceae bacterium]
FDSPFFLPVPGKHIALNAACAIAVNFVLARDSGVTSGEFFSAENARRIQGGLARFTGAKRRSEILGEVRAGGSPVLFIDDYGHHPTAIAKTLAGYREFYPRRFLIADFMSHTYSRTGALFGDFVTAFDTADAVILHKIYASARERAGDVSGRSLFEGVKKRLEAQGKGVYYFDEPLDALDCAEALVSGKGCGPGTAFPEGALFVTMGAGDNWKLGDALLGRLKAKEGPCGA